MNYKYNFTFYRFSILNLMGHMVADFFYTTNDFICFKY